ncbi:hypothetical protein [Streptomyces sp. NPDC090036]|uniref:hypothetical protein n=1 Tax=Streptomyces sp. NPDC090036 TaxID=3365926 RepID=UPI00380EDE1B
MGTFASLHLQLPGAGGRCPGAAVPVSRVDENRFAAGHGVRWYSAMSRMAQIIVMAGYEDEVMEPLTRYDETGTRTWSGKFEKITEWFIGGWYIEFCRSNGRSGVLNDLEALPWDRPERVQVMLHDEEDDCFALWMFRDGVLKEIPIPGTQRIFDVRYPPKGHPAPGVVWNTYARDDLPVHAPEYEQDPRLSW